MSSTVSIRPNGQLMDLMVPSLEEPTSAKEVCLGLSRIRRFGGSTDITVEEHAITMALSALALNADPLEALYLLNHDNHEPFTGDIITPVYNILDGDAKLAIDRMKANLDEWIFQSYISADLTQAQEAQWRYLARVKAHRSMDAHAAYREVQAQFGGATPPKAFHVDRQLEAGDCKVYPLKDMDSVSHKDVHYYLVEILQANTADRYTQACDSMCRLLDLINYTPEPRHFASIPFMQNQQPNEGSDTPSAKENA